MMFWVRRDDGGGWLAACAMAVTLLAAGCWLVVAGADAAPGKAGSNEPATTKPGEQRYVVILDDSAGRPGVVAKRHAEREGAKLERVFTKSVDGYAARLTAAEAKEIARQPGVAAVGLDPVGKPASQWLSTDTRRVFAADADCNPANNAAVNQNVDIDCIDDLRVDVDVAVLDTPIDPNVADINIVSNVDCFGNDPTPEDDDPSDHTGCDPDHGEVGNDCFGNENHGEAVSNPLAAIDNGIGTAGVAPGARIWSVGVSDKVNAGPSSICGPFYLSDVIAGVEWVTAHADDIEVANMSMQFDNPTAPAGQALDDALEQAIDDSINAGVVYVAAAGNRSEPLTNYIPAKYNKVITATAIYDSDGLPGGNGAAGTSQTICSAAGDQDDTNAAATNYGPYAGTTNPWAAGADIAAPGNCTSLASANTSGAAALLASADNPNNSTDVATIRNTLLTTGNTTSKTNGGWDDETGTTKEPLLDVSDEGVFDPHTVSGDAIPNPDHDVDGDGRADLVALRTNGVGYVHGGQSGNTFTAGVASFGGGGGINSALYDGTGHFIVDVSDVNGDTRGDLVTVDSGGVAHAYRGQSDRTFAASVASDLDLSPALLSWGGHEPIAVADVDGNGRSDLVVYDDQTRDTLVYPGQTNGTFGTGIVANDDIYSALHTGSGEYFVDVADVTGDGRDDLITMTTWNDVWVRPGQSNGTFGSTVGSYWNGVVINTSLHDANGHEPIGVDDVTGDGRADLVTSQGGSIHVYPGLASGYFASPTSSFSGALASSLFTGTGAELATVMDVNGDSHADLVGRAGNTIYVTAGQTSGTFPAGTPSLAGQFKSQQHFQNQDADGNEIVGEKPLFRRRGCRPLGCLGAARAQSDVNGDKRSDLVTLSPTGIGRVNAGTAAGNFSSEASSFTGQALNPALYDGTGHYVVDVADVNGDMRGDLVTVDDDGVAHAYRGQSDRTFAAGVASDLDLSPALLSWGGHEPIAVADVDGNGRSDLVVYDDQTRDTLVYPGQANGTFGTSIVANDDIYSALHTGAGEYFVDVADVTGDGRDDLVTMTTWNDVWVRPGQSNGTFGSTVGSYWNGVVINTSLHDGNGHEPIGVDDVTGDGRADLVTSQGGSIHVYPGLASGYFDPPVSSFGGTLSSTLFDSDGDAELATVMDINGDGHADLVAAATDGTVHTYRGRISGSFAYPTTALTGVMSTQHAQHQNSTGREIVTEKPAMRRRGCPNTGCS